MHTFPATSGPHVTAAALRHLPVLARPDFLLFPGVVQVLRLTESRHVAVLEACRRNENALAVVLIAPGEPDAEDEPGGLEPRLCETACAGIIVASEEHEDGAWTLLVYGTQRIRLLEELETAEPFRRVRAEPLRDELSAADSELADSVRGVALQICDNVPGAGSILNGLLATARSPGHLADLLSANVLEPVELRQECLEILQVADRLRLIKGALGAALLHLVADPPPEALH